MEDSIELTLQSVHGIVWNPSRKYADRERLSMKACVSFSGSAPNMQVSSFNMCPRTGNLVVVSNDLGISAEHETLSSKLSATFEDSLEGLRSRRRLGSCHSASGTSTSSNSSYRPHLQFQLQFADQKEENPEQGQGEKSERTIDLHVTIRSDDAANDDIYHEGIAYLIVGAKFDSLPVTMNLPITPKFHPNPNAPMDTEEHSQPFFTDSAYVRVLLSSARNKNRPGSLDAPTTPEPELVLSDNIDEKELGGMVRMMHEREEMDEARYQAVRLDFRGLDKTGEGNRKARHWMLNCSGGNDFKQSFQAFFDVVRGCDGKRLWKKAKCLDSYNEISMNITMASTIDTRDSLEI
jgi:hypothetical protein